MYIFLYIGIYWLKVLTNFGVEVSKHFGPKKIHQVAIHNFLSQIAPIPTNHILQTGAKSIFTTFHQILY